MAKLITRYEGPGVNYGTSYIPPTPYKANSSPCYILYFEPLHGYVALGLLNVIYRYKN